MLEAKGHDQGQFRSSRSTSLSDPVALIIIENLHNKPVIPGWSLISDYLSFISRQCEPDIKRWVFECNIDIFSFDYCSQSEHGVDVTEEAERTL